MFDIEENVPIPQTNNNGGRHGKYPWAKMKIGDSFFIPARDDDTLVRPAGPKLDDRKFTSRADTKEIDGETVRGTRVWCIANDENKAENKAENKVDAKPAATKGGAKSGAKGGAKSGADDDLGVG